MPNIINDAYITYIKPYVKSIILLEKEMPLVEGGTFDVKNLQTS